MASDGADVSAAAPEEGDGRHFVVLASGQRVFAIVGKPADEIRAIASTDLRPEYFPVMPEEIDGWVSLSKSGLKREMTELQWSKLRAERTARAAAKASAVGKDADEADATASRVRPWHADPYARALARPDTVTLVIDCDFDELMTHRERASMFSQICMAYSSLRHIQALAATSPACRLVCTSVSDAVLRQVAERGMFGVKMHMFRERFDDVFRKAGTVTLTDARDDDATAIESRPRKSARMDVSTHTHTHTSTHADAAAAGGDAVVADVHASSRDGAGRMPALTSPGLEHVVYLSAESPEVLTRPTADCVYVLGGLVDRNRHKGVTYARAQQLGLRTARFPISECGFRLSSSLSLTTLAAADIAARVAAHGDWKAALEASLPKRKMQGREDAMRAAETEAEAGDEHAHTAPLDA